MNNFGGFFPFVFIGIWILATYMIARMGWTGLAANYQTNLPFTGERVGIISATINKANYKNSLILKYNEEGIYLRPIIIFRLFHKPILIPWKEIKEVRHKKILFTSYKELVVGHPFAATISISNGVFEKLENSLTTYSMALASPNSN